MVEISLDDLLDDESTVTVGDDGGAKESTVHEHELDKDEEPVPCHLLPFLAKLFAKMSDSEKVLVEASITDAMCHIRKLRNLFASAKMEGTRKSIRQFLITALLREKCSLTRVLRRRLHQ